MRGILIPRPRLADLLNTGLDKKFTLIAAPAGFGKTTLVLTTLEDPTLPLARLRARDQLTEIKVRDLRFNQGEADIFCEA